MTLKKYLRPGEAAFYLERLLGYPVSKKDIFDLHSEGKLLFVARFTGVRIVQDDGVGQKAKGDRYHDGYFVVGASRKLKGISVSRSSTHYQLYEWVKYYGDNPPAPMTSLKIDDPIRSAVSKAFGYLEYGEAFEEIYNPNISYKQEDMLIPRAELDALIAQHQADSTPAPAPVAASEPAPQDTEAQQPTAIEEWPVTGNIERRNQIKQDLQGMARIIAAHWWSSDTAQTTTGDMADKVFREVAKFAPDGFMPETVEAVRDWIKPLAPEYARKPGRRKTP